jgi:hypothetical protein
VRAALCDGEDYELLFAVAAPADRTAFARAWRRAFPRTRLSCLGRFVRRSLLPASALDLKSFRGYEHLKSAATPVAAVYDRRYSRKSGHQPAGENLLRPGT